MLQQLSKVWLSAALVEPHLVVLLLDFTHQLKGVLVGNGLLPFSRCLGLRSPLHGVTSSSSSQQHKPL